MTGIYTTNSPEACELILKSSQSNIVVVDDDNQLNKILSIKDKLPNLKSIVKILPPFDKKSFVYSWNELEEMNVEKNVEDEYKQRLSNISPNDCCSLCYTSGTTGKWDTY